jgi:4-amino-4-deoxy-L-arabinose transferase-like glycosyltransferase
MTIDTTKTEICYLGEHLMEKTQHNTLLIIILLTVLAAFPRFYNLGHLGFQGDEETTSLASRSVAEGNGPKMPSGMPYYRALPQTWLNAISAKVFGFEKEISYRIPSAILGTLTIPLTFIVARSIVGFPVALIAALMLSFSEWHILVSREARMYAPFLLFYVLCGLSIWNWTSTGSKKYLLLGAIFFFAATTLHYLALLLFIFFLIPIAFPGWLRIQPWRLITFALLAVITGELYSQLTSNNDWFTSHGGYGLLIESNSATNIPWLPNALAHYPPEFILLCAALAAALGVWSVKLATQTDNFPGYRLRAVGFYVLGISCWFFALIGQLYGASILCLLFFLIHPENGFSIIKKLRVPGSILIIIAIIWVVTAMHEYSIYEGLKSLTDFPFAYPAFMAQMLPGVSIIFIGMCIYLVFYPQKSIDFPLRASAIAALAPILGIGLVSEGKGMRYLIETYPFIVLVASAGLLRFSGYLCQILKISSHRNILASAILIVLSGILGGHGLPQAVGAATLRYGESLLSSKFEYYPDHKGAGEFVKNHRAPDDIVLAEDVLQQYWYSGSVDYWFRNIKDTSPYLYKTSDGLFRDIYVNSAVATIDILTTLTQSNKRIWLITSAETYPNRNYYLSEQQRKWLSDVETKYVPVFVGRDEITKVYFLNCNKHAPEKKPS